MRRAVDDLIGEDAGGQGLARQLDLAPDIGAQSGLPAPPPARSGRPEPSQSSMMSVRTLIELFLVLK